MESTANLQQVRRCNRCEQFLSLDEFGIDRAAGSGRQRMCLLCGKAYRAAWYQANRERVKARNVIYRESHTVERAAQHAVEKAIIGGRLTKPTRCTDCSKGAPLEAHHDDYAKPLDVRWLCRSCHQLAHA